MHEIFALFYLSFQVFLNFAKLICVVQEYISRIIEAKNFIFIYIYIIYIYILIIFQKLYIYINIYIIKGNISIKKIHK